MQINSFFLRSTASSDLAKLFRPAPSSELKHVLPATSAGLDQSGGTGKKSIHDAVKAAIDLIAKTNPDSVSVATVREGYVTEIIVQGSQNRDVISYAAAAQVVTAYIDAGGDDDTITFSSSVRTSHQIQAGEGNDTVAVATPWVGTVDGGGGNDAIGVSGEYIVGVNGGSGNDTIAVAAGIVPVVEGGEGNDTISVSADFVAVVSGGDGDDVIAVSSNNRNVYDKGGDHGIIVGGDYRATMVDGGKGNDKISIDGDGYVFFGTGDGQDVITINNRTEVELFNPGFERYFENKSLDLDKATITNENGKVVVTFAGRDEKLTFQSANGEQLRVEILDDDRLVVEPAATKTQAA